MMILDTAVAIIALIGLCVAMLFVPPAPSVQEIIKMVITGILGMMTGAYIGKGKDKVG